MQPADVALLLEGESGGEAAGASSSWLRMVDYLKAIGATEVLKDEGSFKVRQAAAGRVPFAFPSKSL